MMIEIDRYKVQCNDSNWPQNTDTVLMDFILQILHSACQMLLPFFWLLSSLFPDNFGHEQGERVVFLNEAWGLNPARSVWLYTTLIPVCSHMWLTCQSWAGAADDSALPNGTLLFSFATNIIDTSLTCTTSGNVFKFHYWTDQWPAMKIRVMGCCLSLHYPEEVEDVHNTTELLL